ncbi:MAG: 5'/3'-nucleotidase SurE [Gammaproteobacteria bacterium]|jgi:5'-nucleotidase|nr:5'/3'-nucleotidase SurE [Gammaproteobacteria bacterium]
MNNGESMHILLTNDDGHRAPGILALKTVLKSKGYRVSMVAPSDEQSATSMSTTTRRNLAIEQLEQGSWHLDAQPADTVLVALRHILEDDPPDLVLSGINFGPNLGVGLHASGTIGAAIVALLNGYPAIAVSAGMLFEEARQEPRTFPSTLNVLEPAAEFTCAVIESLRPSLVNGGRLLPAGILLNINYPALPRDRIKGVLYPEVSSGHMIELGYDRCGETGKVVPRYYAGVDPDRPHTEEGDVRAHLEGYITVSPVKPGWNPSDDERSELLDRLDGSAFEF